MGRRAGRDAALTSALIATLEQVAEAMRVARKPWWVIGSASVVLHGCATEVGDVDVLLSIADAEVVATSCGMAIAPGSEHPLFRSMRFFTWKAPPLAVEFMAGFAVRREGGWGPVEPFSRERMAVGSGAVFVPSRAEMRDMLLDFGRPKDAARAALLGAGPMF